MVLIISVCYILGPIRQEISSVLHVVLHTIEMPDQVLSHNVSGESQEITHSTHDHKALDEDHEHKTLSFIEEVINSMTDDPFSSEVPLEKFTHHKHINDDILEYEITNNLWVLKKDSHSQVNQKIKEGYLNILKEPPRFMV